MSPPLLTATWYTTVAALPVPIPLWPTQHRTPNASCTTKPPPQGQRISPRLPAVLTHPLTLLKSPPGAIWVHIRAASTLVRFSTPSIALTGMLPLRATRAENERWFTRQDKCFPTLIPTPTSARYYPRVRHGTMGNRAGSALLWHPLTRVTVLGSNPIWSSRLPPFSWHPSYSVLPLLSERPLGATVIILIHEALVQ